MFMRVSHYTMKPEAVEAATKKVNALKSKIMSLPGVLRFTTSFNDDGTGCTVSLNKSKEQSDANAADVQEIWSHFKDFLVAPPVVSGFEVDVDWSA